MSAAKRLVRGEANRIANIEHCSRTAPVVVFGGTEATLCVAEAAVGCGVSIAAVVSAGEVFRISYSPRPVHSSRYANLAEWCDNRQVPHIAFTTYDEVLDRLGTQDLGLGLVAGWYHLVPLRMRQRFALGCVGFHASLLPQLRGGAPLNWAILAGLRETGVTMYQLGDGVDDGPCYAQKRFPVAPDARIAELVGQANDASRELVRRYLGAIVDSKLKAKPQKGVPTYALQRRPEDGLIDWRQPASDIDRLVRAVGRPYPGAYTHLDGKRIQVWEVATLPRNVSVFGAPGQITHLPKVGSPCVVTGQGVIRILEATDETGATVMDLLSASGQKRFST